MIFQRHIRFIIYQVIRFTSDDLANTNLRLPASPSKGLSTQWGLLHAHSLCPVPSSLRIITVPCFQVVLRL